jgi:hypothetical protein
MMIPMPTLRWPFGKERGAISSNTMCVELSMLLIEFYVASKILEWDFKYKLMELKFIIWQWNNLNNFTTATSIMHTVFGGI